MRFQTFLKSALAGALFFLSSCSGIDGSNIEGSADNKLFLSHEINAYHDILKEDSTFSQAHLGLGWAYLHDRKYELSVHHFNETLRYTPENAVAFLGLGIAYEKLKKYDLAKKSYVDALKKQPNWYFAHYQLGRLNIKENRKKDAMENVQFLVAQNKVLADRLIDEIYK